MLISVCITNLVEIRGEEDNKKKEKEIKTKYI